MSEFNIEVEGGSSVRLPTAGKYCDRDIVVEATEGPSSTQLKSLIQKSNVANVLKELPDGITRIGAYAFAACGTLGFTSLPDSVTSIGAYGFMSCSQFTLDSLPDELASIGMGAFQHCTRLALTSLPEGLTSIYANAFNLCEGLNEMTFKGTPTTIDSTAFAHCTNLLTINVPWAEGAVANAPWGATNATINYNYTGD